MLQAVEDSLALVMLDTVRLNKMQPKGGSPPLEPQAMGEHHKGSQALLGLPMLVVQAGRPVILVEEEG